MNTFKVGDHVVHLSHGVGIVRGIEERQWSPDKDKQRFYILEINDNGAPKKVFVPFENASQRIRNVIKDSAPIYKALKNSTLDSDQTWTMRYRKYIEMIHSGDVLQLASVVKVLYDIKNKQDLSFGERKLLDMSLNQLTLELSLCENKTESEIQDKIESILEPKTKLRLIK